MVSVGLGRGSRGLTAIPVHAEADQNRGARAAATQSSGPRRGGFLSREERRLRIGPKSGNRFSERPMREKCRCGEKTFPAAAGGPPAAW
jgi:hypothetical protein